MVVSDVLAGLEGMLSVADATATRDAEGVLSASFSVLATDHDRAGTRARELFSEAARRAGVDAQWHIIATDEGPPVGHEP